VPVSPASTPDLQPPGFAPAYHIELRQFPHNTCHFNLTAQQLSAAIVEPWAREKWIDIGDRKWNPNQAKLTVIEGPHIPVEELSMGRGWRTAQRQGHDVTERLLTAARERIEGGVQNSSLGGHAAARQTGEAFRGSAGAASPQPQADLLADSLGLELMSALGCDRVALHRAWELAGARYPERTPGECLILAELAVASLLRSRLVVLAVQDEADGEARQLDEGEAQTALRAIHSWSGEASSDVGMLKA
jgi:hypothetical protein